MRSDTAMYTYVCIHTCEVTLVVCNGRVWLFATLWTGFSVHGILQAWILEWEAWILEWEAMPSSSRGSSWPRDQTHISYFCTGRRTGSSLPPVPSQKPIYIHIFIYVHIYVYMHMYMHYINKCFPQIKN